MKTCLLSICIPTYNRAVFLAECLESLALFDAALWDNVEIVVSDNASTDNTKEVVERYRDRIPIRYFRNATNIGGERNFFAAARHGLGEYVWVFGDDDILQEPAVASALQYIGIGFDLIVLNYSVWSRGMDIELRSRGIARTEVAIHDNANAALASLGLHLGYISSVVVKRSIFLSAPEEEYEQFVEYGFSHLYSTYRGLPARCRAICLPDPVFRNRADNCEGFIGESAQANWNKYFIEGSALVFEMLGRKGYSPFAVARAKGRVLKDFITGRILAGMNGVDRLALARLMYRHYRWNWRYWFMCAPALILPGPALKLARKTYMAVRRALH
ncbi:MAG: glycosyltransferase family 2 protein [Acidobacteriota bacterium]